jgi:AmmeMemoRadiSam system protein B
MGLPSEGDTVRGQLDTVGFVVTREQAEDVVAAARRAEEAALARTAARYGLPEHSLVVGGVAPHDDHLYSGRILLHLTERITAPRVVLFGVFHKARLWDLEGALVFDSFESWHAPWAPVPVDQALRTQLVDALPEGSALVSNTMHCAEHSLEALLPFLQAANPRVQIVPILVPYLSWERLDELSGQLASALAGIMAERGWRLGRDLALVASSDAVHYGPDFDYSPHGVDANAYLRAVQRDGGLIRNSLQGPLAEGAMKALYLNLVSPEDIRRYRVPWCGRFSIPLGMETLRKLAAATDTPLPTGHLLRYGTSLSEPELPVSQATRDAGLGTTAPSNFHHWVGYASVAYLVPGTTEP